MSNTMAHNVGLKITQGKHQMKMLADLWGKMPC